MTVVACIKVSDKPTIISDMMLSRNSKNSNSSNLKSFFPVFNSNIENKVKEMGIEFTSGRKIYKISDYFVIGWAGDYENAKKTITELKSQNFNRYISREELTTFFEKLNLIGKSERRIAITGWFHEKQKITSFCWYSHNFKPLSFDEKFYCIGSGSQGMVDALKTKAKIEVANVKVSNEEIFDAKLMGFLGALYLRTLTDPSTFKNRYGYGFEVCTLKNNKFSFMNNLEMFLIGAKESGKNTFDIDGVDEFVRMFYYKDHPFFMNVTGLPIRSLIAGEKEIHSDINITITGIERFDIPRPKVNLNEILNEMKSEKFFRLYMGNISLPDFKVPCPFQAGTHFESDIPFSYIFQDDGIELIYNKELMIDVVYKSMRKAVDTFRSEVI